MKLTLISSGPAGDIHPRAMGVYNKLSGLPPVWENYFYNEFKLSYDGKKCKELELNVGKDYFNQGQDGLSPPLLSICFCLN